MVQVDMTIALSSHSYYKCYYTNSNVEEQTHEYKPELLSELMILRIGHQSECRIQQV